MTEESKHTLILVVVTLILVAIMVFVGKGNKNNIDLMEEDYNNEEIRKQVKISNIALTNKNGEINLYNVKDNKIEKTINPFKYDKNANVLYSGEGEILCGINKNDNKFVIIDLKNFETKLEKDIFTDKGYNVEAFELCDNKAYFSVSSGERIVIVDLDEINEKEVYLTSINIRGNEIDERIKDIKKDKNEVVFITDNFILREKDGEIESVNIGEEITSMLTGKNGIFFTNSLGKTEEKSVLLLTDIKEFNPQKVFEMDAANPCHICFDKSTKNNFLVIFNGQKKSPFIAKVTKQGTVVPYKKLISKVKDAQTVDEVIYILDEKGHLYFYSTRYLAMFKIEKIKDIDFANTKIHVISKTNK